MWTDGSAWDFTRWNIGEPNNKGGESCLDFYRETESDDWGWNDNFCDGKKSYVCKTRK